MREELPDSSPPQWMEKKKGAEACRSCSKREPTRAAELCFVKKGGEIRLRDTLRGKKEETQNTAES